MNKLAPAATILVLLAIAALWPATAQEKPLEQRVADLERRVAVLERRRQAQPAGDKPAKSPHEWAGTIAGLKIHAKLTRVELGDSTGVYVTGTIVATDAAPASSSVVLNASVFQAGSQLPMQTGMIPISDIKRGERRTFKNTVGRIPKGSWGKIAKLEITR